MAYQIVISDIAERQLRALPAHDLRIVETAISTRLTHQPTLATRAIKPLRPNPFAQYELRVGDYRILYNVDGQIVLIRLIGRKAGNSLFVEGREFHDHQENPAD